MGGALALHSAYRFLPGFAGAFALSSFLNRQSLVYERPVGIGTPLFMCHGDLDTLVELEWGRAAYEKLQSFGVKGEFTVLKNTLHELKKKELEKLMEWIGKVLPPEN